MSRRDVLIAKLSDSMDRDNAVALVAEVIHEAAPMNVVAAVVTALVSIARSACCEPCQEAALVAREALDHAGIDWRLRVPVAVSRHVCVVCGAKPGEPHDLTRS